MRDKLTINYEAIRAASSNLGEYDKILAEAESRLQTNTEKLSGMRGEQMVAFAESVDAMKDLIKMHHEEIAEQQNALNDYHNEMRGYIQPSSENATLNVEPESLKELIDRLRSLVYEAHVLAPIAESTDEYRQWMSDGKTGYWWQDMDRILREQSNGTIVDHIRNSVITALSLNECLDIVSAIESIYRNNILSFQQADAAWAAKIEALYNSASAVYVTKDMVYKQLVLGKGQYNWEYLVELMNKAPEDLTNAEYNALTATFESMTYPVVDADNLRRFLQSCYINFWVEDPYLGRMSINSIADAGEGHDIFSTLSPVFGEMMQRYQKRYLPEMVMQIQESMYGDGDPIWVTDEKFNSRVFNMQLMNNLWLYCHEGHGWVYMVGDTTGYDKPGSPGHTGGCMVDLELNYMNAGTSQQYDYILRTYQGDGLVTSRSSQIEMYSFRNDRGILGSVIDSTLRELYALTAGADAAARIRAFETLLMEGMDSLEIPVLGYLVTGVEQLNDWDNAKAAETRAENRVQLAKISKIFSSAGVYTAFSIKDGELLPLDLFTYNEETLVKDIEEYNEKHPQNKITFEDLKKCMEFDFSDISTFNEFVSYAEIK